MMQVSCIFLHDDPSSHVHRPHSQRYGTYGNTRVSKDISFDESVVFDKYIDNSPTDEEFAALPVIIENEHKEPHEKVKIIWFGDKDRHEQVHTSDCTRTRTNRETHVTTIRDLQCTRLPRRTPRRCRSHRGSISISTYGHVRVRTWRR